MPSCHIVPYMALCGQMQLRIERTSEFIEWFDELSLKEKLQVDSLIQRIRDHSYFGDAKSLGDGLAELKWKNGKRIYFAKTGPVIILLLNGGLKNAQKKDIKKARLLLERYANSELKKP